MISSAVPEHNVEVRAAHARGHPGAARAEVLAAIVALRRGLGVAGTHGKTTTSSMITLILRAAGLHPSFLVGSELNEVGTNEALDTGEWLIVEADESDGTFLELPLEAAIVTNVDNDHLWYWGDLDRLRAAFAEFVAAIGSLPVLCADDPFLAELADDPRPTSSPTGSARARATGPSTTPVVPTARRSCSTATASRSASSGSR